MLVLSTPLRTRSTQHRYKAARSDQLHCHWAVASIRHIQCCITQHRRPGVVRINIGLLAWSDKHLRGMWEFIGLCRCDTDSLNFSISTASCSLRRTACSDGELKGWDHLDESLCKRWTKCWIVVIIKTIGHANGIIYGSDVTSIWDQKGCKGHWSGLWKSESAEASPESSLPFRGNAMEQAGWARLDCCKKQWTHRIVGTQSNQMRHLRTYPWLCPLFPCGFHSPCPCVYVSMFLWVWLPAAFHTCLITQSCQSTPSTFE